MSEYSKIKAKSQVRGIKQVLKGKRKGETKAMPGDVFEPLSEAQGKRLVDEGFAEVVQPNPDDEDEAPAPASTIAPKVAKAPKGKAKKAEGEPPPIEGETDDLGLGE